MRLRLLALAAVLGTVLGGFSHTFLVAADEEAKAPMKTGSIQVEVKGTLVCKGIGKAFVSVQHKDGESTRIWIWESEGRWKALRDSLPPLDGQQVTVRGQIRQLSEKSSTSIPGQALYFTAFEIETKAGEKITR